MKTLPCINTLMCDRACHALVRSQRGPCKEFPHIEEYDLTLKYLEFLIITGSFNIELACVFVAIAVETA